jgi:hypothetical protein
MAIVLTCYIVWVAFESKSQIKNIIDIVEYDFHNIQLGLMVWLAKLASLFVWLPGNYCCYLVNLLDTSVDVEHISTGKWTHL